MQAGLPGKEDPPAIQKEEAKVVQPEEEEYVDFSQIGKIKKTDLPENLRNYPSPQEILKQAAHARRYANSAEEKIRKYEERIADLESTAKTVPDLQKQLNELKKASDVARRSVDLNPPGNKRRDDINKQLDAINDQIAKLKNYDGDDADALQGAISGTVEAFKVTAGELELVRSEFSQYRKEVETKHQSLEDRIKSVSDITQQAEEKRKLDFDQKTAERNLAELQTKHDELRTSKPLYSDDHDDVETAIVNMTQRVYGRKPKSFDEVNRFVSAFNTKNPELVKQCEDNGINPADYGINSKDIRNYGILMSVYWMQQGETIDPHTGTRVPATDWRGNKVTYEDYESAFLNMKEKSGISQAEKELAIIEAEKKGQQNLDESLRRRDTSTAVLEPTGAPPEGQEMSEEQALEVIGEKQGRMTVDEEFMERLLRVGDKRGWEMFSVLQKANETLGMPIPQPESHWIKSA